MPTYTYQCVSCGHAFDVFHPMNAKPKVNCEACGNRCDRLLGTGAGLIFKGSGFYETDFKDKKGTPPAKTKSGNGSEKTAEKKPATKSESAKPSKPSKAASSAKD